MADTSNCNASGFRRKLILSLASAVLAFAGLPALAQTSVTNRASISPPAGVTNPGTACLAIAGNTFDAGTGTCTATDVDTVIVPILTITKTASAASFTVGVAASYTLQVSNSGTAATTAASTITDAIPAGLTIGTLPAGCTAAGQTVTCTIAAGLAVAASTSFIIPVTPTLAAGASVTNTATVSGGGDATCPAATRCTGTVTTPVVAPQLTITKTASAASFTVGVAASYTLNVQNTGPAATTAVSTITDAIPAGLTIGTLPAGCTAAGQTVTCTIASLAPGASVNFAIPVTPTLAAGASVTNTATVSGGGDTTCPAATRCTSTVTTPVLAPQLTITKTASATSFTVGVAASYTLNVQNTGTAATTAVSTITDAIPAGLTIGTLPAGCTAAGQTVTCTIAAGLAAGASTSFIIPVTPTEAAVPGVTNTATVSGGGDSTCPAAARCTGSVTTPVLFISSLTLDKTASPTTLTAVGATVTYSFLVTNTGNVTITGLQINETVFSGTGTAPVVTCPVTTLAALASTTCTGTYAVTQQDIDAGTITNTATASGTDLVGGTSTSPPDTATVTATQTPSQTLVKALTNDSTGGSVSVGDVLEYTVTLTNTGNTTLTGVVVNDPKISPNSITCPTVAPGGTCVLVGTYTVIQSDADAGTIQNVATATSPVCPAGGVGVCTVTVDTPVPQTPSQTLVKELTGNADQDVSGTVTLGDTLTYTVTVTNTGNTTLSNVVVSDPMTTPASITCASLVPGALCQLVGTYTVVAADVTAGEVSNTAVVTSSLCAAGSTDPACTTTVDVPVLPATTSVSKSVDTAGPVLPGATLTYTLTTTVAGSATAEDITLTDTLGPGLTFGAVTVQGEYICTGALVCTLPAGKAPGIYTVSYTATVDAGATGTVSNAVVATTPPGGDPDPVCTTCTTDTPVTAVATTVSKTVDPASGTEVNPGQVLTYTLTTVVANSATTEDIALTDTLGAGLTFGTVIDDGAYQCTGSLVCVLPAGTLPGSYPVVYTATVDANATGSVGNNVTASTPPGGDPDPVCTTCTTDNPVISSTSAVSKQVDTTGPVNPGQILTYTLTTVVSGSATIGEIVLTDTLGSGLTFGAVTVPGAYLCTGALVCTLPAGTLPGTYAVSYTATVNANASGSVRNAVVAETPGVDPEPECNTCNTDTPVAAAVVTVAKGSDPGTGTSVGPGDVIGYILTVTVANASTTDAVTLTDTMSGDQTFTGAVPAGCVSGANGLVCTLPAGTLPGTYTYAYSATVDADATGNVGNSVVPTGGDNPTCDTACVTEHPVVSEFELRILKTASVREVKIGDLVRYTLVVENVGDGPLVGGVIVDTPPAGFSYVEGSLSVIDGDNMATAVGQSPIRFEGVDIAAGQGATLVYTMRVGAGVRPGVHVNQAQAFTLTGLPISNITTAEVALVVDAMVEDSLLLGTVFDDRDSDGWQDRADLSGVRVQGGFAPSAYVANSTTVDRGTGHKPEADASSPLLHGIAVGAITARQSVADPASDHQVVISQRLSELAFTSDFVLTSAQGVTVRMDAAGNTTVEKGGEAAKGLNAAEPKVERRVAQGEGGYVVDYVISNLGIDERGIPGVRIASVEGLLIETDQFGRYHLAGIHGGDSGRGRNFILKVDPSTLPPGSVFTTDNPLLRRITQGVPVRFDFGVKMPVEEIQGGEQQVELELGEVIFAPGSAKVREEYLPVIGQIAAKVVEYRGGEVLISANGDTEALAFDRANAVKTALLTQVPAEIAGALTVSVRGDLDDPSSMIVGVGEGGALLGTVLFDTDKSAIKPRFLPVLAQVADYLDKKGGGSVAIVGHTDPRASDAYNLALGMRRAKAVYEAITSKLSPEVRSKVRVESSNDPAAPAGNSK